MTRPAPPGEADGLVRPPATERVAAAVADVDLAAYQRAARLVLRHPVITSTTPRPGALVAVRRWGPELRDDLAALCGARLEVTPRLARLVRRPSHLDPTHPLRSASTSKRPFDHRRYAYFCLALAELLRSGPQVLLTDLAERVKRRADAIVGLGLDPDQHTHRVALVDAVRTFEVLAVLTARDGTTTAYASDAEGDALYDVDGDVAAALFAPPARLQHLEHASHLQAEPDAAGRDTRRRAVRQRLTRRLLDQPVLLFADCTEEEAAYLRREAPRIAADVERLTGCAVERRVEGLALLDVAGELTDRRFPGNGTAAQVALLLCDTLGDRAVGAPQVSLPRRTDADAALAATLEACRPSPPDLLDGGAPEAARPDVARPGTDTARDDGPPAQLVPFVARTELLGALAAATERYGAAFKKDLRDDPDHLLDVALEELAAFDLVRPVDGGVAVVPVTARFRADATFVPAAPPSLFDAPSLLDDPEPAP